MSDEESFVILGTSPSPSLTPEKNSSLRNILNSFSSVEKSFTEIFSESGDGRDRSVAMSQEVEGASSAAPATQTNGETQPTQSLSNDQANKNDESNARSSSVESQINAHDSRAESSLQKKSSVLSDVVLSPTQTEKSSSSGLDSSIHKPTKTSSGQSCSGSASRSSLAASFILGEVDADVLKNKVYTQFPSLRSMETQDVDKLQNLMAEYLELKKALNFANTIMKQLYGKTQQWRNEMLQVDISNQKKLEECFKEIDLLRKENMELKRDLHAKIDEIALSESTRQKSHDDLVQKLSEKSAIIENMRTLITKLEKHHMASIEFVGKTKIGSEVKPPEPQNDSVGKPAKTQTDSEDKLHDSVHVLHLKEEHECVVKNYERRLSELLAKNIDHQDMQKLYVQEIQCLKVKLASDEELIKKQNEDIISLKKERSECLQELKSCQAERAEIREEIQVLREQVKTYHRDFEMERVARSNLAGEKAQLLQDLRLLQRRNHELIAEAQRQCEMLDQRHEQTQTAETTMFEDLPSSSDSPMKEATTYSCPVCSQRFKTLSILEAHVNDCLDGK